MTVAAGAPVAVQFEATIIPQRSLSRTGLRILLGAVLASCVISGTACTLAGAWPVGVFAGFELALAAILFHLHVRAGRTSEVLLLTDDGLQVIRTSIRGPIHARQLSADWLAAKLEERPGRVPSLLLIGHGIREEIGRDLGDTAKRALAQALADALRRRRSPEFDNPQLR